MKNFPIYTKTQTSFQMMLSPHEVLNIVNGKDMFSEIKHIKYETMVTNAFEEYCSGESKVITHDDFLAAYVRTQGEIRNLINLHQPIEMDHTSILINESKNEIK